MDNGGGSVVIVNTLCRMASEEDFAGSDEDGVMAGGVEDASALEPPVHEQQQAGRKRSGRSTGSRRAARSPRREEPDSDGRVIYHDDPDTGGDDDNRRRSWFSNLCRCCRRGEHSEGLERTKSDVTYAGYAEADDDIYRKMCIGTLFAVVHLLLALLAVFATYSMVKDLITSMKNPVRSVHYRKVENYEAPGECKVIGS